MPLFHSCHKRVYVAMVGLILHCIAVPGLAEEFTIGVVPQFTAEKIQETWVPILNDLQRQTGHNFLLRGSQSTQAFQQEYLAGQFDFAYMDPYHYLRAAKSQGYMPLVRDTAKQLQGILVVRKDSAVTGVKQLEGKKIAFPSPNAFGASLMIRASLSREFKIKFVPEYVKSHDSVYLNVVTGRTVAGGGVMQTLEKQSAEVQEQLRVIYTTAGVPPHPILVHPRVAKEVREAVQQALLAMGRSVAGQSMLQQVPITRIGVARAEDYKIVTKQKLDAFYVAE